MTSTEHNFLCDCGKPTKAISETEYEQYLAEYGDECPLTCNECAIETLRLSGWEPGDFAKYTPDLAKLEQRRLANEIFKFKRLYRRAINAKASIHHEINRLSREIKINEGNPFFGHMKRNLAKRIEHNKDLLAKYPTKGIQNIIFGLVELFDQYGNATPHEYAVILSTSHVHVEKALTEDGIEGLIHLVVHHVEDGANIGDSISDGCILHESLTGVMIREIMNNKTLRESTDKVLDGMFIEATGRPLPMYTATTQPNGEPLLKRIPPRLSVVNQSKPIEARNSA